MAGIIIATASYDRSIRLWDAASTRCTRMIAPPKDAKNESVRLSRPSGLPSSSFNYAWLAYFPDSLADEDQNAEFELSLVSLISDLFLPSTAAHQQDGPHPGWEIPGRCWKP